MRLGIGSWTYGWAWGGSGYPLPANPLTSLDLIDRAVAHGFDLVQIANNLPMHKLSSAELVTLRDHATRSGISIEIGTVGFEREHLQRYLHLARFLGARGFRDFVCLSLRETWIL